MICQMKKVDGVYLCDINIPAETWLELIMDYPNVFTDRSLFILELLWREPNYTACCFDLGVTYHMDPHSINGVITTLADRVCRHLGISIRNIDGRRSVWMMLMERGEHQSGKKSGYFMWTLRSSLAEALSRYAALRDEPLYDGQPVNQNEGEVCRMEGEPSLFLSIRYERDPRNRAVAI